MSVRRHLLPLVSWITVEPVEFIYCVMFSISSVVRDNLFLDKVCRLQLNYTDQVCYNLTHKMAVDEALRDAVQTKVAALQVYDGVLVAVPSVLFSLFLGAWSDKNGRKWLLILPFVGNLASFAAYLVNFHFFQQLSTWHLLWGSVVGLTGSYFCLNIGLYGYVSDVTTTENRTMRMSILNGVFSGGYVVGTMLGGYLYNRYENYYLNFGLSCGFGLAGIAYTVLWVPESVRRTDQPVSESGGVFNLNSFRECWSTTFKQRPHGGRLHVILLVINFAIFMFCLNTTHYDYLYVMKKFHWDVADFSKYLSVQRTCRFLGLFILLPLLSRKLSDAMIASLGTILTILAYLLAAVGQADWQGPDGSWPSGWIMYLAASLQFNSIITVTIRSQCTKEVDKSETGRIFAVVALGQAIVPLVSNPLFGGIYTATLKSYPGAYLLLICGMLLFVLISSSYMACHARLVARAASGHHAPVPDHDTDQKTDGC